MSMEGGEAWATVEPSVNSTMEWTTDWFADFTVDSKTNPHGPQSGRARVTRGGGWQDDKAWGVRAYDRYWHEARFQVDLGFRCARDE